MTEPRKARFVVGVGIGPHPHLTAETLAEGDTVILDEGGPLLPPGEVGPLRAVHRKAQFVEGVSQHEKYGGFWKLTLSDGETLTVKGDMQIRVHSAPRYKVMPCTLCKHDTRAEFDLVAHGNPASVVCEECAGGGA